MNCRPNILNINLLRACQVNLYKATDICIMKMTLQIQFLLQNNFYLVAAKYALQANKIEHLHTNKVLYPKTKISKFQIIKFKQPNKLKQLKHFKQINNLCFCPVIYPNSKFKMKLFELLQIKILIKFNCFKLSWIGKKNYLKKKYVK